MKQLSKKINDAIDEVVLKILNEPLTKRSIDKMIRELRDTLLIPTEEFRMRLLIRATKLGDEAQHKTMNALMTLRKADTIAMLTNKEISTVVEGIFTNDIIFSRLVGKGDNKKRVDYSINVDKWIKALPNDLAKKIRSNVIAGYLNSDSQAEIIANLKIGRGNDVKTLRRHVKAIVNTVMNKSAQQANLEVLRLNSDAWFALEYRTVGDDKVDDVCSRLEGTTWTKFNDIKENEKAPTHPNCRCRIVPINEEDYNNPNRSAERIARHLATRQRADDMKAMAKK